MATNLALDDDLILQAQKLGGHATKKAAVTAALTHYIRQRRQVRALSLFAQVDFNPDFDYKAMRRGAAPLGVAQTPAKYGLSAPPPIAARPAGHTKPRATRTRRAKAK